jgi:hypothetical protein
MADIASFLGNSFQSLVIVILLLLLTMNTKNKINMNFSKKSNQVVLGIFLLILAYMYRSKLDSGMTELQKDADKPGTGFIGQNLNYIKRRLKSLKTPAVDSQVNKINAKIESLQEGINYTFEMNPMLQSELEKAGAMGYIFTTMGNMYSIKPSITESNAFILESKIDRQTMLVQQIKIDKYSQDYMNIYQNLDFSKAKIFNDDLTIATIFVQPDTEINDE